MSPRLTPRGRIGAAAVAAMALMLVSAGCASTTSPTSPSTTASPTTSTISPNAVRAAAYVASNLKDGDHVEGKFGPDLGQTSDVALGLAASGGQAAILTKVLAYLNIHAGSYVHGDPSTGEKAGAHYAGSTGKLALVAKVTGKDPASFGGLDLISELRKLMGKDGRFRDDSKFGDYSNPLGQSFDILALERGAPEGAPRASVDNLLTAQCADGGFAETFPKPGAACSSSPDATGLALQALVATDNGCTAVKALSWLTAHQQADGSFANKAVDPSKPATSNVNSTAYAALGLVAGGQSTAKTVGYLSSAQSSDGGLAVRPGTNKKSDVYATAQALDAFAGISFLTIGSSPITAKPLTCSPTPSST